MSLDRSKANAYASLTEGLALTKRAVDALFADVQRARTALAGMGERSDRAALRRAFVAVQAVSTSALSANCHATLGEADLDVLDALDEAAAP